MNGREIPGFYFDPEKNKYFKILGANASRGLDLKYSAENIRKRDRVERVQKTTAARYSKTRTERVVRRHASNLTQTCAEREIGFRRRSFYIQNLWPDACIYGVRAKPTKVIDKPADGAIRCFDRDPVTKTVYAVHGENRVKRRRLLVRDGPPLPRDDDLETGEYFGSLALNPYTFEPWDELGRTTSCVSTLCYLPATGALATTTQGSDRAPVVQLSDPDRDGPYVSQQFTPKHCTTIWGAAARPTTFEASPGLLNSVAASHTEHLAVAASSSMLIFTRSQAGSWDSKVVIKSLHSDILALDWISYTTVALGTRDGKIRLHDTRSGGSSHVLTHSHPISKLKRADDQTRIICSGLQDSLLLYDIRSPRLARPSQPLSSTFSNHNYNDEVYRRDEKKRRKLYHVSSRKCSQPVVSFTHANLDETDLAIDVHARLGLVAAAQDSEASVAIRVSNIWTGKTVKEFKREGKGATRGTAKDCIRSLKFVDRDDGNGGVDLWTSWEGGITRFGW